MLCHPTDVDLVTATLAFLKTKSFRVQRQMKMVNKYILIQAWEGLPDTPTTLQSECVLPSLALCKLYRQGVGGHIKSVWADWSV